MGRFDEGLKTVKSGEVDIIVVEDAACVKGTDDSVI